MSGRLFEIRNSDDRGRHIIAKTNIKKGSKVVSEKSHVMYHSTTGKLKTCDNCYQIIGSLVELVRQATGDKTLLKSTIPYLQPWELLFGNQKVTCECGVIFCSEECKTIGNHFRLCAFRLSDERTKALREYNKTFSCNERFTLLLHHCMLKNRPDLSDYDQGSIKVTSDLRKLLREAVRLLNILIPEETSRVTTQEILNYLNIYNVNCHTTCILSPLFSLRKHLRMISQLGCLEESIKLEASLDLLINIINFEDLHSFGVGLFKEAACMNHNCDPNCRVTPNNINSISVVATKSIKPNDELTISYIDEVLFSGKPVSRRDQLLPYNFTCSCDKCINDWNTHSTSWVAAALVAVLLPSTALLGKEL